MTTLNPAPATLTSVERESRHSVKSRLKYPIPGKPPDEGPTSFLQPQVQPRKSFWPKTLQNLDMLVQRKAHPMNASQRLCVHTEAEAKRLLAVSPKAAATWGLDLYLCVTRGTPPVTWCCGGGHPQGPSPAGGTTGR